MKVAMVTGSGGTIQGGIDTYLRNICSEFRKLSSRIEIHIVTIGEDNWRLNQNGIIIHFIKKTNIKTCKYHYYPWLIRKKILEIDPDVIHIQATFLPHNSIAVLSLVKRYPVILTVHGILAIEMQYMPRSLKLIVKKELDLYLEKLLLKKVPHIIVGSPAVKKLLSDITNSNIYVVPNGVDIECIKKVPSRELKHPCLFFAGRLQKIKGVDILLKAVAIIRKSLPDVHLYIAGSGPEEVELKNLAKNLGLEKNVTFLGFISNAEVYSYFKSIDVCVLPSHFETFGLAALEAMACGKPVVAANTGGIPYVVDNEKTGLLFERGNLHDLAQKATLLLQNKELKEEMGRAGKERAKEYTWDKIAKETIEIYEQIGKS